jgi:hypothetical protein
MPLKRKESLREGLQCISEKRLQDILQRMGDEGPTAESVHEARKVVKSLRAVLRLARGALGTEERKTRNEVLRNFAHRFSRSRDAAVTLGTLERIYPLSLKGERPPNGKPHWATQLQQSLALRAHATLPAKSYRDAMKQMRATCVDDCCPSRMMDAERELPSTWTSGRVRSQKAYEKLIVGDGGLWARLRELRNRRMNFGTSCANG